MPRKSAAAFLLAAGLLGCDGGKRKPGVSDPAIMDFDFKLGDRRLLLREFRASDSSHTEQVYSLGVFEIAKDTVVERRKGWIIESTVHELRRDGVVTYSGRQLMVSSGGEVSIYRFRPSSGDGFLFGLLKPAVDDTAAFSDGQVVLKHPLRIGERWALRQENNPWGNLPIERELVGTETLVFQGREHPCMVYVLHSFSKVKSWVSRVGLMKAEIDHGTAGFPDGSSDSTGVPWTERYELLELDPTDESIEDYIRLYQSRFGDAAETD
jgi:hypothetical protein